MNKHSVSSLRTSTMYFTPESRCLHCDRWTSIGQAERESVRSRQFHVDPLCHEHGYYDVVEGDVSPEERELEYASITRFVVWMQNESGTAQVVGPCPVTSVPGYEEEEHTDSDTPRSGFVPKAWTVIYTLNGASTHLHVVYDYVDWKLSLYIDGQRV
jgi:hypothetical protein